MVRRLGIVFALVVVVTGLAGCYGISRGLGAVGGCDSITLGSPTCAYARAWSRNAWHQQQFIDQYFLNYDVNDPYRCDCPIYDYCPCGSGSCGYSSCPPAPRSGS
jgi:hypothetical protein